MTMQEVFQELIDFCTQAAPADPRDAHLLAFHLDPVSSSVYPYNGTAMIHPTQGLQPYYLDGYGIRNTVFGHPTPNDFSDVVRVGLHIGRPNPIEAVLEFGGMNDAGGFDPGHVDRTEDCDATAERIGNTVAVFFETSLGRQSASFRKTNVLHTAVL